MIKVTIDRELLERIPIDLLVNNGYNQTASRIVQVLNGPFAAPRQPDGSYIRIGLDHPTIWLEDEPYDHLVPLYMIEGS